MSDGQPMQPGRTPSGAAAAPRCEVVVLSTLHQHHARVPGYDNAELARIVEWLQPDVLALELDERDIAGRVPQNVKQEYQNSIYPLLDRLCCVTLPLEPPRPHPMRDRAQQAQADFRPETHAAAAFFATYIGELISHLLESWQCAADVNSAQTDAMLAVKHRFQNAIAPANHAASWEEWNQFFLERIVQAVRSSPGKRVVATVGVEHAYWLRARLSREWGVELLDTELLLRQESRSGDGKIPP